MSCCRICRNRDHAMHACPSSPRILDISLVTFTFKAPISTEHTAAYIAFNHVLNDIIDTAESSTHPTTFTTWSPCLSNPCVALILTTASEVCSKSTAPIFKPLFQYLKDPPHTQHIFLDYSIMSLASTSTTEKISCDIITVSAPNPGVAGAIGKQFGWDPKRSSLSTRMAASAPATYRTGDLIRDFWAWAELHPGGPISPSLSSSSQSEGVLRNTNSEEKNMSLFFPEDDDILSSDDETLVMIFQWASHSAGDRFKHPTQTSNGHNNTTVNSNHWDYHVAHPVRQLEGIGAKVQKFRLELRGVEERIVGNRPSSRERSGSNRLSSMALGLGERVSGLWK